MRPHWFLALVVLLGRTVDARAQKAPDPQSGTPPVQSAAPSAEPSPTPPPVGPVSTVASPPPSRPAPAPIHLQPDSPAPPKELPRCENPGEPAEGAGMFFLGLGLFDFAELNRHLRANGYEPIDMPLTLIGGELKDVVSLAHQMLGT